MYPFYQGHLIQVKRNKTKQHNTMRPSLSLDPFSRHDKQMQPTHEGLIWAASAATLPGELVLIALLMQLTGLYWPIPLLCMPFLIAPVVDNHSFRLDDSVPIMKNVHCPKDNQRIVRWLST
jgi:hypothetical protein